MVDETMDSRTRAARRAVLIDGIPVVVLGGAALMLGSSPDQTPAQKGWWLGVTVVFSLAVAWVLVRAFRRADEYQRRVQLESMAVGFAAVLVGMQVAMVLDATGLAAIRPTTQIVFFVGIGLWLVIADLRVRLHR